MDDAPAPKADHCVRIVVWNCRSGFDGPKFDRLLGLEPDVAIVAESCTPERLAKKRSGWTSAEWVGRLETKGLGVLSFGEYVLDRLETVDTRLEWVLPLRVRGPVEMMLFGVWAMNRRAHEDIDVGPPKLQPRQLLRHYPIDPAATLVVGDFNNSPSFDKPSQPERHFRHLEREYLEAGLVSAYHRHSGEAFGIESVATFHGAHKRERGHHIDYCFVPSSWRTAQVWVGRYGEWVMAKRGSDHVPLVVDLEP